LLSLLPWLLLFFIPAVCMRSFAEERNAGTLELVLAQPIQVVEFLLGKFLGVLFFLLIAMAGTLGIPLGLTLGADLQWGVVFSQYLGSMFLVSALIAVGLWASSLTRNQVTAFIIGVTVSVGRYLIGLPTVTLSLPGPLAAVAARLGVLGHFSNVARGVIDLRDVLYFAALGTAFLSLTYFSVMRERLSRQRPAYGRLRVGVLGLVGLAIFAALAGAQLRGRLDLTPGKVYTLSPPTADLLRGVDDLVTLKLFQSAELPAQLAAVGRDVDDLLRDLDATGGANVNLVRLDPDEDPDAREEAGLLGIRAVPFQVMADDEVSYQERYFALAVQYAGESQIIPLIRQTADLEYRLATMIRALTRPERPMIGILTGHGELSLGAGLRLARGTCSTRGRKGVTEMVGRDWLDAVLDLGPEWKVTRVEPRRTGGSPLRCPHCGEACQGYDTRRREWRNLDAWGYKTFLACNVPRVQCPEHGVVPISRCLGRRGVRGTRPSSRRK